MKLKLTALYVIGCFVTGIPPEVSADRYTEAEREAAQRKLDLDCEKARARALYPMRIKIYETCKSNGGSEAVCDNEAATYNANRINGAARFYDLPECEAAFEFQQSQGTE